MAIKLVKKNGGNGNGKLPRVRKPKESAPSSAPDPFALTTPATLNSIIKMSLGLGTDHAFAFLNHLSRDKRDQRLDDLCLAYARLSPMERSNLVLEDFCKESNVESCEFLGWLVMSITAMGGNASRLIIESARLPLIKASLERALANPAEARAWLEALGHFPIKSNSQIINVNASTNIAAISARESGLPSFEETLGEIEEIGQRRLPESSAVEAEFTPIKETVNVG